MNLYGRALVAGVMAVGTTCILSQVPQHGVILGLSKADHTLAMVDAESLRIIAKMPVGSDPHEVVPSSDGKTAYVSIYGHGHGQEIDVIDLEHHVALSPIDTTPFFGPHGLAFVSGKLYFSAEGAKAIARYDPLTKRVDWAMGTGQNRTHMIFVTPIATELFATNVASGTVSILEQVVVPSRAPDAGAKPVYDWMQTIVPVSEGSEGFDLTPDRAKLWTAASKSGDIYIIDTNSKKVESVIKAAATGANRVRITPDGKLALISSLSSGIVFVFDTGTHNLLKQIKVGTGAAGVLVSPDGTRAFIGCTPDNYVAIIDLKSLAVAGHLDIGGGPDGLAWLAQP